MSKVPKKSAGPFTLWHELSRDDSYRLRSAFNPDKAEYVAHVEDGIDLDTAPQSSDTLPDIESQNHAASSVPSNARRLKRVAAAVTLLALGLAGSFVALRNRPADQPGTAMPDPEPSSGPRDEGLAPATQPAPTQPVAPIQQSRALTDAAAENTESSVPTTVGSPHESTP